ncbi:MAG: hypothetical protein ACYCZE_04620 [Thiobacillus sp.]
MQQPIDFGLRLAPAFVGTMDTKRHLFGEAVDIVRNHCVANIGAINFFSSVLLFLTAKNAYLNGRKGRSQGPKLRMA